MMTTKTNHSIDFKTRGLNMKRNTVLALVVGIFLASTSLFAAEKQPIDKELDYFWGKKRGVEVIQKRQFLRESRHEFTIFAGSIPNDDFFVYYPIGGRYNWYFAEDFAFELNGTYLIESQSDLEAFLEDSKIINVSVYLPEKMKWYAALDGQWTPFHGKFSVFTQKLTHFDINFSAGIGVMVLENTDNQETKTEYSPMGNLGAGFRFYLTDYMALRLDYRHFFYKSEAYNGLSWPIEVTAGLSFFTSAPK